MCHVCAYLNLLPAPSGGVTYSNMTFGRNVRRLRKYSKVCKCIPPQTLFHMSSLRLLREDPTPATRQTADNRRVNRPDLTKMTQTLRVSQVALPPSPNDTTQRPQEKT